MRSVRRSRLPRLLWLFGLLGLLLINGASASADTAPVAGQSTIQEASYQAVAVDSPAVPLATAEKYGSYVYTSNGIYRARVSTIVLTNDANTVNDVQYCIFRMQKKFGGGIGWKDYAWNNSGYTLFEWNQTTKQEVKNTVKKSDKPSSALTTLKMPVGNNLPRTHKVGCYISVVMTSKQYAAGYVFDGTNS